VEREIDGGDASACTLGHFRGSKQQVQGCSTCCGGQNRTFRFCYAGKLHAGVELRVEGLGREEKWGHLFGGEGGGSGGGEGDVGD